MSYETPSKPLQESTLRGGVNRFIIRDGDPFPVGRPRGSTCLVLPRVKDGSKPKHYITDGFALDPGEHTEWFEYAPEDNDLLESILAILQEQYLETRAVRIGIELQLLKDHDVNVDLRTETLETLEMDS